MEKVTGYVTGVNGNLVSARFSGSVRKNEVGFVKIGNDRLKGEVIRISGDAVSMQIYEMTNGIQVGDEVELTGELLSVELGPGLLTQVYDGLQNPLPKLAEQCGFFLERGVYLDPIPDKEWEFTPCVKPGDAVLAGDAVGSVPEGQFTHLIMAPFDLKDEGWRVKSVKEKGVYHVRSTVAVLENGAGEEKALSMVFSWPVKQPIRCYEERLRPDETLVTKIRCIDTFLPVAKGGTFCVPGPFGAGKTVLQHMEAKNADVDIVIVAACGERAGIAKKPAPDMLLAIMRQLKAEPASTIYIGDSDTDLDTARNAGVACIGACWGFRGRAFLEAHGAKLLAENVSDIWELIK